MKWTRKKPTRNGWYWCWEVDEFKPNLFEVIDGDCITNRGIVKSLECLIGADWAGPIEEPTE